MPEHRDSPYCGCWGCVSAARESLGCVVHGQTEPGRVAPAVMPGLNLCGDCNDRMISNLRFVASKWDDAQTMLHPGSGGGDSDRHAQRTEAPLPINVSVSDALRVARDNVWSVALGLVDHHDDLRLPDDQTTPSLAEWMSRWQAGRIAGAADKRFTQLAYWWIDDAAGWILSASHGAETIVAIPDQFCKRPGCGGQLVVVENRAGQKIVQCQGEAKHAVQWDMWSQMLRARKPRGARPPKLGRV